MIGTVVAGRFEIEALAGKGGMGSVYRARDRVTGGAAAVKILHDEAPPEHHERLAREGRILTELTHPAFVRYLGFGATETGKSYLAMEWLEGEDLSARLKRIGLGAGEAVRIAARVATALAVAHGRGVIHRDIKPSNLYLVDGDPDRVKVLDFGIARVEAGIDMTRTGAAIGTPRYMAPEQARGSRDLDARADVFSLGCVLFECLAGRPPFSGADSVAVFAKILLEDAPSLATVRDDLPLELVELVARMLAKEPAARPRDGGIVASELDAIGDLGDTHRRSLVASDSGVTAGEQRLVCVVFAASAVSPLRDDEESPTSGEQTLADAPHAKEADDPNATYTVVAQPLGNRAVRALAATVSLHRGRGEILADGSLVVTMLGQGVATDQAARAARCALAIRELVPHAPMALAIGRCVVGDRLPLGELIDRATSLVRGARRGEPARVAAHAVRPIRVDEVSAGLLDVRFAIEGDDAGLVLAGERDVAMAGRTLLGKPIPCIGRERELGALVAIFEECVAEPMAHVVVVTAAAGVGKSRLRYELLQRLEAKAPEIWIGRGDPMNAGSPFAMLGQALRRAAAIVDDEPLMVRHRKLRARILRHVPEADAPRVVEFLGELVGAPPPEPVSVQLRAARNDAQLMGDQMLRACEDFFAAECSAHPLVLVLEDLQWSDVATVQFVDAIARRLADKPLLVLALGRPDVDQVFPRLWSERKVERVHLGELTRRSAEKLVREALGKDVDAALVGRLVDRAAGNAFYLEELIRSVAEGHGDRLPETVIAMVQARIEALEVEARHVLRAASIFGEAFWRGGVTALLEGGATTQVDDWLEELVRRELVTSRRDARFADEVEYTFRHALVREAAYAMLTDRDRTVGHRLAGEWLEARVKREHTANAEAVALAEHFLRGDAPQRSIGWYRQAAEQALEGNDLANAIEWAERAIACIHAVGPDDKGDAEIGALRQLQADGHSWRGEYAQVIERGTEALERLPPGSRPWLAAAGAVADSSVRRLDHARLLSLCRTFAALDFAPELAGVYAHAVAMTMTTLLWHGDAELIATLFAKLDAIRSVDPVANAWIYSARAWKALREGDHAASLALDQKVEECLTLVGDLRQACRQHANVGYGELMLGAFDRAERSLREAIHIASQIGLHQVTAQAQHNLGLALARQGKIDEGRDVEHQALAAFDAQGNRRLAAGAYNYLALIELAAGQHDKAIEYGRAAVAAASEKAASLSTYRGTLSAAYLAAGHPQHALEEAAAAIALIDKHGHPEEGEVATRLAYARALDAAGSTPESRAALGVAVKHLRDTSAKIGDTARRAQFVGNVVENAAALALAEVWGVS